MNLLTEAEILALDILTEAENAEAPASIGSVSNLADLVNKVADYLDEQARRLVASFAANIDASALNLETFSHVKSAISKTKETVRNSAAVCKDACEYVIERYARVKYKDDEERKRKEIKAIRDAIEDKVEAFNKLVDEEIKKLERAVSDLREAGFGKALKELRYNDEEEFEKALKRYKHPQEIYRKVISVYNQIMDAYKKIYAETLGVLVWLGKKFQGVVEKALGLDDEKFKDVFNCAKKDVKKVLKKLEAFTKEASATIAAVKSGGVLGKIKELFQKAYKTLKGEYGVKGVAVLLAVGIALYLAVWAIGKKIAGLTTAHLTKPITLFKKYFAACKTLGLKGLPLAIIGAAAILTLVAAFGSAIKVLIDVIKEKFAK